MSDINNIAKGQTDWHIPLNENFVILDESMVHKPDPVVAGNIPALTDAGDIQDSGILAANVFDSASKVVAAVVAGGGSGSGIDADKLDGYHSTSFLRVENLGSAVSHTFAVANGETAYAVALRSNSMYGVFALTGNSAAVVIIPIQSSQVDATNSGRNVTISASVAITLQVFRTR